MHVAAPMTFAAFLARYGATGRVKGDGYDRSMVADLTDAERERARAMLLERGLAGDTTDVAGLRLVADDATIAALREAAVLAPLRGVEWQVTRIETLFALTGDAADLDPLLTLLDIRRTREAAAQALARVALPFAFAESLATRLERWRYRRVALPLVIAWLQTRGLDLRDPVAFQSHLPLVRRIVRALPWRRMSVLAAVARELQNATPTRDGFEWLIAPLPEEARALVRERCRYDGEPRTAAELFARLLGWMNSEGIAEGRGGYPGGRGTPGWSDYVSLQHRHLAIYHELVAAHGEAPRRIAENFRDYERSFPPSVRLLGTGWEAVVDDVAGRLIYSIPVVSGIVTVGFSFPIRAEDFAVLKADPYRRAVLEVVAHHVLQRSIPHGSPEVTQVDFAAISDRVLHGAADDLAAYIGEVDRDHRSSVGFFVDQAMARYAANAS